MPSFRPLLLCVLCASAVIPCQAEDWPQWRGPDRTGHVPANVPVPDSLPAAPKVLFKVPVGNGLSSPIVADNKLFHLDNQANKETLHANDAITGQPLWHATLDDVHKDSQSPPGPRCTPLADGDKVYAQSCRGQLTCFSAADGKPIWQTNFVKDHGATFIGEKGQAQGAVRHGYNASPLIDGDRLIAFVGGKDNAAVVAFDKSSGKVLWKSQDAIPAYAPPVIATIAGQRQLLAFMVEGLFSLDPADGKLLWQVPLKTTFGRHAATPVVIDDTVIVSSHQLGLIGVKVTKDGAALKAEKAWSNKDAATNFASPVAIADHCYLLGPQKNLICVDPRTGQVAWSRDNFSITDGGHAHAGLIAMGQNLLVLTDGGQLVLLRADPKQYREIGRVQVSGTTWCNPAYANGALYLRDAHDLYAVRLLP